MAKVGVASVSDLDWKTSVACWTPLSHIAAAFAAEPSEIKTGYPLQFSQ